MNTAGSNRPSLVAEAANRKPAQATAGGRILAGMENREPVSSASAFRNRLLLALLAAGAVVLVILALGSWWPATRGHEPAPLRHAVAMPDAVAAPAQAAPDQGGAIIVDDPQAATSPADALAGIVSVDTDAVAGVDAPPAARAAPSGDAGVRAPARRVAAASAPAVRAAQQESDPRLLASLLSIIRQEEKAASGEQQHESMDALIARIQDESSATRTGTAAARASNGGVQADRHEAPSRSQEIQDRLRACPAANTLAGIECRKRVCAPHQGKDGACPASQ